LTRVINPPDASSLMATARSFGNYDLAAALADVIDNSITAEASNIDLDCDYLDDGSCIVRIRDDGRGMSRAELMKAMCPASTHPSARRAVDDLGRFGWGMKSASFSQCRVLTVVSRTSEGVVAARWDLDDIDGWQMDLLSGPEAEQLLAKPFVTATGTELIWTNCDRLSEGGSLTRMQFSEILFNARKKLSQIFHRLLAPGQSRRLAIRLNGAPLDQLDPFCEQHRATIPFDVEPIDFLANGEMHRITMQAYVLPHYSKLTAREYEEFGGEDGYVRNQGFYVYRNRRLIISGTWFGLARYGELSKLVRVRIDIPNSLDEIWKITVDKSDAQLPSALRSRMKDLVARFRAKSVKVHRSKGARIDTNQTALVWERHVRNGVIRYTLNEDHPILDAIRAGLDDDRANLLSAFLRMAESHIPVDAITKEDAQSRDAIQRAFLSREEVVDFLVSALPGLMASTESPGQLLETLRGTEPLASNWNVTETEFRRMFPNA
jgi:hypothetical protein